MTDKEKEAIEYISELDKTKIFYNNPPSYNNLSMGGAIEIALNLIEKQQAEIEDAKEYADEVWRHNQNLKEEIENKDKIIDELVKSMAKLREISNEDCFIPRIYMNINDCIETTCEKCIIEYFKKKAKKEA